MPAPHQTIPWAWRKLGLPGEPPSRDGQPFCSPFRADRHPGCFLEDGLTTYSDFGGGVPRTGVNGFAALALGFHHDAAMRTEAHRREIDERLGNASSGPLPSRPFPERAPEPPKVKNMAYLEGRIEPTEKAILSLARLRRLPVAGVRLAVERGLPIFGYHGPPCLQNAYYGLYDEAEEALSVRRMNGQPWPGSGDFGEHKCKTPQGWSTKNKFWGSSALGDCEFVILIEGAPDYLSAHVGIADGRYPGCAVLAAMTAKCRFTPRHLSLLQDRSILCFPQNDVASMKAAIGWQRQLQGVAESFEIKFLPEFSHGARVKDLNDAEALPDNVVPMESAA